MIKKKRGYYLLIFLLFFVALIGIVSATTYNCTNCSDCSSKIQTYSGSGNIIQLNTSISDASGNCIDFGEDSASNVIFDCLNFSNFIDGDYSGNDQGIWLRSSSNNNIIRNCNVTQFYHGFYSDYNSNNTFNNIISNSNNDTGIFFNYCDNNNLTSITTNSNNYGVYFNYGDNNILTNITSNSNSRGIRLDFGSNNTLTNSIANNNDRGVTFQSTSNSSITNITTTSNNYSFDMFSSSNNILTNITSDSALYYGFNINTCSNNTLTDINLTNSQYGFYFYASSNNTLADINLTNSQYGFYFYSTSNYNTINDSRIENSTSYGMYFNYLSSNYPQYNTIYNNIFNNTVNYYNTTNLTNYFNTPKRTGLNIMGGLWIGGNYWTNSTGNDFSDTCTDSNSDGICDSNYNVDGINQSYDYFALSSSQLTGTNCSSCSDCSTKIQSASSGESVYLITSISYSGIDVCIDFGGKDNITFDCLSYSNLIDGDYSGNNYGIFLNNTGDGSNNNTIKNCNISEFENGIYITNSDNNTFINIISFNNTYGGIYFLTGSNDNLTNITTNNNYEGIKIGGSNNNLTNIITNNNTQGGVHIFDSNNSITNLTSNNNKKGIDMESVSNKLFITDIIVQENEEQDIKFSSSYCNHNFTNVTGSGGRAIEFYNYTATIQDKELAELILCGANNSVIDNVTVRGSDTFQNNYFYLIRTNNTIISNVVSNGNYYGIMFDAASNNTLTNVTTNNTKQGGIFVYYNSTNNTLINVTSNGNPYGLISYSGQSNTIRDSYFNSNNLGIYLIYNASYNIINNTHIENNTQYGIKLMDSGGKYPQYNLIYNNLFNNTANYYNKTNLTNYFNTTKTSGTNIVGGSYIGGNYWENYSAPGTGFSETCTDADDDKICDSSYNVDGVNQSYDYLPLVYNLICTESWTYSAWSICTGGTQTRTATDANNCETTNNRLPLSQSCTSEPGGGSGIIKEQPTQTHTWDIITANEPATMTIIEPEIHLTEITITTSETLTDVSLTVTEIDVTPQSDIQIRADGTNYQGFKIDTTKINDTNIANAVIEFKVNKTWLDEQNLTYDDVTLYRKPGIPNIWDALNTTFLTEDSQYYYFSAISPGFSTFVIFIGTKPCNLGDIRCFNNELQLCVGDYTWVVTEKCRAGCENNKCVEGGKLVDISTGSLLVYTIVIVLTAGALVVLYFVFRFLSKKHSQTVWKESKKTEERI